MVFRTTKWSSKRIIGLSVSVLNHVVYGYILFLSVYDPLNVYYKHVTVKKHCICAALDQTRSIIGSHLCTTVHAQYAKHFSDSVIWNLHN